MTSQVPAPFDAPRLLLVEDEAELAAMLRELLRLEGRDRSARGPHRRR